MQNPGICIHFTLDHSELKTKKKTVLGENLVSFAPQPPKYHSLVQGQAPL